MPATEWTPPAQLNDLTSLLESYREMVQLSLDKLREVTIQCERLVEQNHMLRTKVRVLESVITDLGGVTK